MLDNTQQQADATTGDTSQGNTPNIDEGKLTLKQVMARAKVLGKAEGLGENSRPGAFLILAEAAARRVAGKDDVAPFYQNYALASAEARKIGYEPHKSEKQQVSKLAVAVRLGELPHVNAMVLLNKVIEFQDEQRTANKDTDFSPFDGLVKVARYQINKSPNTMLDDDVIRGLLLKNAKEQTIEADILERVMKAADSAAKVKEEEGVEQEEVSQESRDMLNRISGEIAARIAELGGSTKDRKRAAKAAEEAQELTDLANKARAKAVTLAGGTDPKLVQYLAERRAEIAPAE